MGLLRSEYVARRAAQQCVRCLAPSGGKAFCATCAAVNAASCKRVRDRRREARICFDCAAPVDGKHRICFDCREVKAWKQAQWKQEARRAA